ncbi:hypothetical protein SAMN05216604_105197 [Pseudomonas agarici]|nr:hypothetical protein SAMN05216604_105197 [Pseudomonas agarici]
MTLATYVRKVGESCRSFRHRAWNKLTYTAPEISTKVS